MPTSGEQFLSGNFAPVSDETTIVGLDVEGILPTSLDGTFLRHGPNPIGTPPADYHPAAGDGMVHAVTLRAGRAVAYRNRWVRTSTAAAKLGVEPPPGPPPPAADRSNDTVIAFAGRLLSLSSGALPYQLTADLDTIGRTDFGGALAHGTAAHAKVDQTTGGLHTVSMWWQSPFLSYQLLSPSGHAAMSAPLPLDGPACMHDFAVTDRYVVVFDSTRVGLVDRYDFAVHWRQVDSCVVGHTVNAHDAADTVIANVIVADSLRSPMRLERWVIGNRADRHVIDFTPQGFPRINDAFTARAHNFAYTVALAEDDRTPANQLLKHDLTGGGRDAHDFGSDVHPGEFVFVADPARADREDGGWLVGLAHNTARRDTRLVVLDAQHIAGPPIATAHIPRRVPFGTHAAWVPARSHTTRHRRSAS